MTSYGYLLPTRGVVLSSNTPSDQAAKAAADIVGLAKRVEALGFESVWVGDSVFAKPRLEPLLTLAAVATATEAPALGTAVYLPTLRHPVNVAHQAATLDSLSGGRLALGVGIGAGVEKEYEQLRIPYDQRGERLDECLDIITALWTGGHVTYDGEYYSLDSVDIGVRPLRNPPLYFPSVGFDPAKGFPSLLADRIGHYAAGWLPIWVSPNEYAAGFDLVQTLVEEADRDSREIDPAFYQDVVVAETEAEALNQAREFLVNYYPGGDAEDYPDNRLREMGTFGPPEYVQEQLAAYKSAGVQTFVTRFLTPNQRDQLEKFTNLI